MTFDEIAAQGLEPTPGDLEPYILAHLEQHGPTKRVDLVQAINAAWEQAAGRPLTKDVLSMVRSALEHMQGRGSVEPSGVFGIWRLTDNSVHPDSDEPEVAPTSEPLVDTEREEPEEVAEGLVQAGNGRQSVYGFYLPAYREQAEAASRSRWPIKIGRTTGSVGSRLAQLTTAMPEPRVLAIEIKTDNADVLEKALQAVLSYRGQWASEAGGAEWYLTNPEEIRELYELIRGDHEG